VEKQKLSLLFSKVFDTFFTGTLFDEEAVKKDSDEILRLKDMLFKMVSFLYDVVPGVNKEALENLNLDLNNSEDVDVLIKNTVDISVWLFMFFLLTVPGLADKFSKDFKDLINNSQSIEDIVEKMSH